MYMLLNVKYCIFHFLDPFKVFYSFGYMLFRVSVFLFQLVILKKNGLPGGQLSVSVDFIKPWSQNVPWGSMRAGSSHTGSTNQVRTLGTGEWLHPWGLWLQNKSSEVKWRDIREEPFPPPTPSVHPIPKSMGHFPINIIFWQWRH